jgi:DNA-directed RNA polymerase specialized sigma24 family protein
MRGLHDYDRTRGELGAWMIGCLKHAIGDYRRDRVRFARTQRAFIQNRAAYYKAVQSDLEDEILEKIDRERLQRTVRRTLELLSLRQERLITRHYLDGVMWKDVAKEEGVTKNAAIQANIYGLARLERTVKALAWPEKFSMPRHVNRSVI